MEMTELNKNIESKVPKENFGTLPPDSEQYKRFSQLMTSLDESVQNHLLSLRFNDGKFDAEEFNARMAAVERLTSFAQTYRDLMVSYYVMDKVQFKLSAS